ncbi:hypothetical protein YH65_04720 [Sulfurovum lithotrophicum]|uniref:Leucine rich repeat variant n=1 Tax=Sulfurovum lithotrophicum TaxID=206403 RepID=A0A7U4M0T7_9BACT|nr:hypothetical protein [Sulfurovum lithotrophicum]AKF24766.1 hypothetical protein YH65_04720 [Sulfurovum lithotrophicum]
MMNEKPTLKQLLEVSEGKKLLFLGKEGIFTEKEVARFLKKYKITATKYLEEDVVGVVEYHRLNPLEEDISNDAYDRKLPLFKLNEFEQLLSEEIDDDALLMAIRLGNDQERLIRLLGNEHLTDELFVRLLKMYRFDEEEEDNRQDRDVIMYTLRRYIDIRPNEEDLLYSYLTLRRLATEATDSQLLMALLGFPNFEFLVRGKEKVTLHETIARNPALSEELIRKLLSLRETKVNVALAGNHSAGSEVLKFLLERNDTQINKALATNPSIDNELFSALLEKENEVISLLLIHQPIDTERLELIEKYGVNEHLFVLIGHNSSLAMRVISKLLEKGNVELLEALSGNKAVSSDVLELIYQHDEVEDFVHLARNPSTPLWILQALYEENMESPEILAALAHNPSLPERILRELFERDELSINKGLASNAALPLELLDILKVDTRLQNELAKNENLLKSYEEVLKQNKVMMNV